MNPPKSKTRRKGVWVQVEQFEDPDSHVGLILSERIRGRPEYSFTLVHFDAQGSNRYVPLRPEGARHDLKDIVASLVARAVEVAAKREKKPEG